MLTGFTLCSQVFSVIYTISVFYPDIVCRCWRIDSPNFAMQTYCSHRGGLTYYYVMMLITTFAN